MQQPAAPEDTPLPDDESDLDSEPPSPVKAAPATEPGESPKKKGISKSDMERRVKSTLEEYLSLGDIKELKLCLEEIEHTDTMPTLARCLLNQSIDGKDKDREALNRLLQDLLENEVLPLDAATGEFTDMLEFLDDLKVVLFLRRQQAYVFKRLTSHLRRNTWHSISKQYVSVNFARHVDMQQVIESTEIGMDFLLCIHKSEMLQDRTKTDLVCFVLAELLAQLGDSDTVALVMESKLTFKVTLSSSPTADF